LDHFDIFVTIALKGHTGGGIREQLAKQQCIQSWFLGHVELGQRRKCNYSSKRTQALAEVPLPAGYDRFSSLNVSKLR